MLYVGFQLKPWIIELQLFIEIIEDTLKGWKNMEEVHVQIRLFSCERSAQWVCLGPCVKTKFLEKLRTSCKI